jgi:hypothetical protein
MLKNQLMYVLERMRPHVLEKVEVFVFKDFDNIQQMCGSLIQEPDFTLGVKRNHGFCQQLLVNEEMCRRDWTMRGVVQGDLAHEVGHMIFYSENPDEALGISVVGAPGHLDPETSFFMARFVDAAKLEYDATSMAISRGFSKETLTTCTLTLEKLHESYYRRLILRLYENEEQCSRNRLQADLKLVTVVVSDAFWGYLPIIHSSIFNNHEKTRIEEAWNYYLEPYPLKIRKTVFMTIEKINRNIAKKRTMIMRLIQNSIRTMENC